jgi:GNAT superfamily N-acetyltransferase
VTASPPIVADRVAFIFVAGSRTERSVSLEDAKAMTPIGSTSRDRTVRPLRTEDAAAWRTLWAHYHAYGPHGTSEVPEALTLAVWDRFFQEDEPVEALVAETDGRLVGFAHIVFHPTTSNIGPVCSLNDLFVEEDFHRRGFGRALLDAVVARARAVNAERVYWHVRETNETALQLYDKLASPTGHVVYRKEL